MLAFLPFLWSAFLWAIPYVALYVGLHYLGGLLQDDPPEAEAEIEGAQSRSWYPHTTQREGLPRPRAYGKNMHYGNVVTAWTDVAANREILYMVVEHGDGPTKGIGSNLVYLNDQPSGNFGSVTIQERLGTMDQTCMTGFEKTKLEYSQNVELKYDEEPITFTTPNDFFDDLEYTICFPNGLMYYHTDGEEDSVGCTVRVRIRPLGGGWTTIDDDMIFGETHEPLFYRFKVSDLGFSCVRGTQYELEFSRRTAPKERRTLNVHLRSVREIVNVAFTRPGKALIGIRAVATARLSGKIDVKVVREDRIINVYNGTSWTLEYSNNRAWVVWDIFTQPVISGNGSSVPYTIERYEGVDPQYLDLEFFYTWAQFCEEEILDGDGGVEPRCACNTIVDTFTDIFSLAHEIAEVGRAHIYWSGHTLTGWIDDVVTTPIDLVTMDSMMAKTWKNVWAVKKELAGVVEVLYNDSKQGYERTSAEFASEDAGGYRNIVSVEGVGINSRGAAVHFAHYLLERNHLIRNINKFRVHKDGFRYKLGQTIRLQSRPANWGKAFRVISSTADTITVDRDATGEVDVGDVLHIRSYNTITEQVVTDTYEVDAVSGRVITATINWNVTPVKGNLAAIGAAGDIKLRRIITLEPTIDNYFNVEVETYDVDLFDSDNIDPNNPNVNYIWPAPAGLLNGPVTRAEISDLIKQLLPPQPDIEIPWPSNLTFTGNEVDTVTWAATDADDPITFRYRGTTYEITPGSTTDEFIYWDPAFTTVFSHSNLASVALDSGRWLMCVNKDGVAYPANAQQLTHCGILLAGTLRAETYLELRQTYVYNGDDSLDTAYPFEIPFKIVSELRDIISVKLSFTIMSFRAYASVIGGGSGLSSEPAYGTTEIGGGGGTSYGGGGNTGGGGPTSTSYTSVYSTPSSHGHSIWNPHYHSTSGHYHFINGHYHFIGAHAHFVPPHAHPITFGIHEESNSPTIHFHIDNGAGYGAASANYNTSQIDLDITSLVSGTGWKRVRFDTNRKCRVAAIIECKLDVDA